MGTVYKRRDSKYLWWRYKGPDGKKIQRSSGFLHDQRPQAEAALAQIEAAIAIATTPPSSEAPTVQSYCDGWLAARRTAGLRDVDKDQSRMRNHVLPHIGSLSLDAVTKAQFKAMLYEWRSKLAPKTVRNIASTVRAMMADALDEELIDKNPCDVHARHYGRAGDADPEWRSGAIFERDEVIRLMTAPELAADRRVFYACAVLSGMRLGEIAGLRWRHLLSTEPLEQLLVAHSYDGPTKTDLAREVPVHPVLQRVLTHWRHVVYEASVGSTPGADDWIFPRPLSATRPGAMRTKNSVGKAFVRDLEALGLRHRRFHDLRRTFISLARQDGARRDHLEQVTHTPRGRAAIDLYTSVPWVSKCEAVATLRIGQTDPDGLARAICFAEQLRSSYGTKKARVSAGLSVEARGVEPRGVCIADEHRAATVEAAQPALGQGAGDQHQGKIVGHGCTSARRRSQTLVFVGPVRSRSPRASNTG